MPQVHFGPFKTCGSSDLPEHIYKSLRIIPGLTVYHTTNDHTQNLTTQQEVEKVLKKIDQEVNSTLNDPDTNWHSKAGDFSRKVSNSAKLIGMVIDESALMFVTRHPLPSDDIQKEIGQQIRQFGKENGFHDVMVVDSHNSIIGDEVPIVEGSVEAEDIVEVASKFLTNNQPSIIRKDQMLYGVAKDAVEEYSEKDGIGYGGMVVHLFKNAQTDQETALIHLDANNAYVHIRSFVLNKLQNKGIVKGELTTSDSHTVARQFSSRGYSPIGDKIELDFILDKLEILLKEARKNMEPAEFHYHESIQKGVRIWGDGKYFDVIIDTLQECIKISQRLLTISWIVPTFFSLILLLFYYNLQIPI